MMCWNRSSSSPLNTRVSEYILKISMDLIVSLMSLPSYTSLSNHHHLFLTPTMSDEYTQRNLPNGDAHIEQLDAATNVNGVARPWTEQIHCKGCKRTKSRKEGQPLAKEMVQKPRSCSGNTVIIPLRVRHRWVVSLLLPVPLPGYPDPNGGVPQASCAQHCVNPDSDDLLCA